MGLLSAIGRNNAIEAVVIEIKKVLGENKDKPDVCAALKRIGRSALDQLEGSLDGEQEYRILFKE